MARYAITFVVETQKDTDPSNLLDAVETVADLLAVYLAGETGCYVAIENDETTVESLDTKPAPRFTRFDANSNPITVTVPED